ncbi:hypothetical protein MUY27_20075 [Mucilaginibacter sp. RS28]|uniref:GLPGLI family protein n=1 Tax=Mucilaginibacter straminoryzae TaxID=2932774 RepID=A0A9X2BBS7_9SPHI|nr:hypothetical protein [Mucilaginibacter straminoryzae]MCJ8212025.1 hypothetical protein [Mucilaginibacter straminoryzae]
MKKLLFTTALIIGALFNHTNVNAQTKATWVIESNVKPGVNTVKFYDDSLNLIKEMIAYKPLNVRRKKVQKTLNIMLDSLLVQNQRRLKNTEALTVVAVKDK